MGFHRWTYEEEFECCLKYLEVVTQPLPHKTLAEMCHDLSLKLPDIPISSIKMKLANIKALCNEFGLNDGLEISPLSNYSEACKTAFGKALEEINNRFDKELGDTEDNDFNVPKGDDIMILSTDDSLYTIKGFFRTDYEFKINPLPMINCEVIHRTYGEGVVIALDLEGITVRFDRRDAKFAHQNLGNFIMVKNGPHILANANREAAYYIRERFHRFLMHDRYALLEDNIANDYITMLDLYCQGQFNWYDLANKFDFIYKSNRDSKCVEHFTADNKELRRALRLFKRFLYVSDILEVANDELQKARNTINTNFDPVEWTRKYLVIKDKLEKELNAKLGKGVGFGSCYLYWDMKKRILKERYNIEWKSPSELNPDRVYD